MLAGSGFAVRLSEFRAVQKRDDTAWGGLIADGYADRLQLAGPVIRMQSGECAEEMSPMYQSGL